MYIHVIANVYIINLRCQILFAAPGGMILTKSRTKMINLIAKRVNSALKDPVNFFLVILRLAIFLVDLYHQMLVVFLQRHV